PGIGAILAHTVEAQVDRAAGTAVPPRRVFTFNPAIRHNDGVIAASVARRDGISYEMACRAVENASETMLGELESCDRLSLGRIGTLMRGSDGSMSFVTIESSELSPSTMWLPELSLDAFNAVVNGSATGIAKAKTSRRPRAILYRVVRMAAAVALLIAVGLAISTPVKLDEYRQASLGISSMRAGEPHRELIETPGHATAPVVLMLRHHSDAATPVDTAAHARHGATKSAENGRYCLVVASLASEAETKRFIKETNDNTLDYFVKDGRYRVYAVQGNTVGDVRMAAEAAGVAARYSESWICRK
ncbi:MAG: hypothetical protein K2L21_07010, partial [Muribaculaceae bacterium]|nr:hypothetical protein [Muribaculaceae bacterium]